jgi:hypothetical protein
MSADLSFALALETAMNRSTVAFVRVLALAAAVLLPLSAGNARALDGDPWWPDRNFNEGNYLVDAFAGGLDRSHAAYKVARMFDVDDSTVVAGLVTPLAGGGIGNLGLIRLTHSFRGPWTQATAPYGHNGNEYLIYPNDPATRYTAVLALKVYLDRIFVLVDRALPGGDSDVHVIVFSEQGQFLSDTRAFGSSAHERGAGLEVWGAGTGVVKVGVVVTRTLDGISRPQFRRFQLQPSGLLAADGLVETYTPFPCDIKSCHANATAYAPFAERIYIAGSVHQVGDDYDYFVMAIDKQGMVDTFFGQSGLRVVAFDQPGSTLRDWLTDIDVLERTVGGFQTQQIALVGEVAQRCRGGIGVVKLITGGLLAQGFGAGGKVVVGGSDAAPGVGCNLQAAEFGRAVLVRDDRVQVGGFAVFRPLCPIGQVCEDVVDARLANLHPVTGLVSELRAFPAPIGAPRIGHSAFWDLLPDPLDSGRVLAVGDIRWPMGNINAGVKLFAILKLETDRLFGQGFQP